jgi:hypothetical protein
VETISFLPPPPVSRSIDEIITHPSHFKQARIQPSQMPCRGYRPCRRFEENPDASWRGQSDKQKVESNGSGNATGRSDFPFSLRCQEYNIVLPGPLLDLIIPGVFVDKFQRMHHVVRRLTSTQYKDSNGIVTFLSSTK